APGKLESKREFEKGKEQIKKYIAEEAVEPRYYGRYFGVLLDGKKISFIRFRKNEWEEQDEPLEVNAQTVQRLLEAIRGLRRKPIDAELLLQDFGPKSEVSKETILNLYNALSNPKSPRTMILYNDWKRVFSQVCAYSPEKLMGLIDYYDLKGKKEADVEKLMFAVHTYYTTLMKLLTSEIVTLFTDSILYSYLKRLEEAYYKGKNEFLKELEDLEEGGIFRQVGIKNLFEADYFAWYLDEKNDEIVNSIFEIIKKLLDYEPATVELTPERVKDLFKRLYQNLVPRDIRHKLGEYFTPDWLAELLLDEVGYYGNPDLKIMDPACGSGTFLVLAIKRINNYAEEHFVDKRTLLQKICNNVKGVDLNPLAVLASKANYLIALADLLRYRPSEGIEIPVYLADSILVSRKATYTGKWEVCLNTSEGEFRLPHEVIDKNLLHTVLSLIEECVKNKYSEKDFQESAFKKLTGLDQESIDSIIQLYKKILELEKAGKNKIWVRLLKNSFAPLLMEKFDYVVGNPPWINWENLPEQYRKNTKGLWNYYGLLEKTKGMGLGKVKRDMAMLFTVRCLDIYVKDDGKYSFLIPFTAYKTQAGAGFRKFLANGKMLDEKHKIPCKVTKIHDLVELYPFESAVNRTSMIIIEKSGKTKFPIPCTMWHNPNKKAIPVDAELSEVDKITKRFDMIFTPIKKNSPETPWMTINEKVETALEKVRGASPQYKAHAGVNTALNVVYWIEIISEQPNGLLITNTPLPGQKKKVKQVQQVVEKDLVYPLIRGREVKKWYASSDLGYIILPVNKKGETLPHEKLKVDYPNGWKYFINFFDDLIKRGGEPYKSKLKTYREKPLEEAEKISPPFYWLFNVLPSMAPYKVVWKRIAGGITGKAVSFASAVLKPIKEDYYLGERTIILNDSLILIPFNTEEEAYYVAGLLNSSIALLTIASYTYEIRQETHITQNINIPPFDQSNKLHLKLSELSKKAHELAKQIYEQKREDLRTNLSEIEDEIDQTVAALYGLTDEELKEIKNTLRILKEGEIEEEEGEVEEEITLPAKKPIEIKVEPLLIDEEQTAPIRVVIINNLDVNIKNVNVKVFLVGSEQPTEKIEQIKKGTFGVVQFIPPALKSGQYELLIDISYESKAHEESLEEKRTLFVKPKKKIKGESTIDKDLEEFLG
ncbi:MAG: N-6 DNA methylase, partial [Thermoplasmatales archaeon]